MDKEQALKKTDNSQNPVGLFHNPSTMTNQ
jgi:hypothetical protein